MRVRIDGRMVEVDDTPKLDPKRKHTIEAVVDRFRVKPDVAQRLAESFETALRVSGGVARLAFLDDSKREELVFSSRHACPVCGYSVPPLEPKMFSFNNPAGACPPAMGWGSRSSSIRSASSCIRTSRSPAAPCAAGIVATRTTSS